MKSDRLHPPDLERLFFLFCVGLCMVASTTATTYAIGVGDVVAQVTQINSDNAINSYQEFLVGNATDFNPLQVQLGDRRGFSGGSPRPDHLYTRGKIFEYMEASLGVGNVEYDDFTHNSYTNTQNVVGTLQGTDEENYGIYVIGGHYDSVSNPGASDNASGTAGVLESARVLSQYEFKATIQFIAFDLEEQGLWGSHYYVQEYGTNGANLDFRGMVALDMIGYNHNDGDTVELPLSTTNLSENLQLQSDLTDAFAAHTALSVRMDERIGGSDHSRFSRDGIPAALAIEELNSGGWPTNPFYHQADDYVLESDGSFHQYLGSDYIDMRYATQIVQGAVGWAAEQAILVSADFDGDGDVDGNDFLAWQRGFGTTSGASPIEGDADGDGEVDDDDFLLWQHQFGSIGPGIGAAAAVPEPTSVVLLLLGCTTIVIFTKRSRTRKISSGLINT